MNIVHNQDKIFLTKQKMKKNNDKKIYRNNHKQKQIKIVTNTHHNKDKQLSLKVKTKETHQKNEASKNRHVVKP